MFLFPLSFPRWEVLIQWVNTVIVEQFKDNQNKKTLHKGFKQKSLLQTGKVDCQVRDIEKVFKSGRGYMERSRSHMAREQPGMWNLNVK